jgi:hypothetical protein
MQKERLIAIGAAAAACAVALAAAGVAYSMRSASRALPTMTLAMDGKSISVGGSVQSGGVHIHQTTTNEQEAGPVLFRLKPGVTPDEVYAFLGTRAARDANSAMRFGTIVLATDAPKGSSDVDVTLQPGQYIAFDSIRDKPTHWPRTTFTVAEEADPVAVPAPDATVEAIEFGFRSPSTLHRGEVVRFANHGYVVHMIAAIGAKDEQNAKQIVQLLKEGKDKQVEKVASGFEAFAEPLSPGQWQQLKLDVKPGFYVLSCFMDTQDHREHTQLDMEKIIQIVG